MKRLRVRQILIGLKNNLPIIVVTALAAFLRLYLIEERTGFDADQEEIAFKAKEILSGNPVLLGPKTSLGGFSIGPGFSYLWAVFSFLMKGDPASGAYLSVVLGIAFIMTGYFIYSRVFSGRVAIILSSVLAISVSLVTWDQNPWAPSLFYLSELITFYGVYVSGKEAYGLPLAAFGLGLGFQSHFAIFLLIIPVAIYLLINKPVLSKKNVALSLSVLFVSILPVLVYDIVQGFVNFERLLSIFNLGITGSGPTQAKLFSTLVYNSANIIWISLPKIVKYIFFFTVVLASFWGILKEKKYKSVLNLSLLFLFVPFFIFLFYKSNFSEYYLMTALVPFVFILGYFFTLMKNTLFIVLALGLIAAANLNSFILIKKPMNLAAKKKVVAKIVDMAGSKEYGVSLNTQPGFNFGYKYVFDYYKSEPNIPPKKGEKLIFTIISPPGYEGVEPLFEVDGIGLRWEEIL